jgi:hypothetical protein
MITEPRKCPRCGKVTEHTVKELTISAPPPTFNGGRIDLTGGFYDGPGANQTQQPSPQIKQTVPFTRIFTCTVCGTNNTVIGDDNPMATEVDDFTLLSRGTDFSAPM